MDKRIPIFTKETQCQDCYKCVRHCPVKAIKVENGRAAVIAEQCLICGRCVEVCPVGAKCVRNDLAEVQELLAEGKQVMVSLAPSFVAEFPDLQAPQLIQALLNLGFCGVSETALGAELVSAAVADQLRRSPARPYISTACPVVVDLIQKYLPEMAAGLTEHCSPMLAHARLLRQQFGPDMQVVFIGPCIAKKNEAAAHPELLANALSFAELKAWLKARQVDLAGIRPGPQAHFTPYRAGQGSLYPVDGGMISGIRDNCPATTVQFMSFSGIENIRQALVQLPNLELTEPLFLELLACEGGCVNGPTATSQNATIFKRHRVITRALGQGPEQEAKQLGPVDTFLPQTGQAIQPCAHSEGQIIQTLATIGKLSTQDELNCGGCGYANCRAFAQALLEGKAERDMCVSYMRQLAQKKANALIKTMPAGVVIVDETLKILDCNQRFAELSGPETVQIFAVQPGLEAANLRKIAPFLTDLFQHVLESAQDLPNRDIRYGDCVLHASIFSIEPHRVAGAILQDVTEPTVHKERIIREARDVIRKNVQTVQRVAYLLGENAAESQASLDGIIESFSKDTA